MSDAIASPGDPWVASGHHLCDRDPAGRLVPTPDLWRAFLARPELLPPEEACAAEVDEEPALLADAHQRRAPALDVGAKRADRLGPDGNDPLLGSLAPGADDAGLAVEL